MHESKASAVGVAAQMQSIRRQHVVWYTTACNFELLNTSNTNMHMVYNMPQTLLNRGHSDLQHDFVILPISHGQHSFWLHIQVLQQLVNTFALGCSSWQNLQSKETKFFPTCQCYQHDDNRS